MVKIEIMRIIKNNKIGRHRFISISFGILFLLYLLIRVVFYNNDSFKLIDVIILSFLFLFGLFFSMKNKDNDTTNTV